MLAASIAALVLASTTSGLDTARIEKLTGATGTNGADGVFRVSIPRTELDVYAGQIRVTPPMGVTAWAAFKKADKGDVVTGELALVEEQLESAESAAVENGLEISGVDHHFVGESPRLIFVHFSGQGDEAALATAVGKAFDAVRAKVESTGPQLAQLETTHKPLDFKKLEATLGAGKVVDDVFRIERARPVKLRGQSVGAEMGAASWAALAGSDDAAALSGAFAVQEPELPAVLKSARAHGLTVTSIEAPFAGEQPHLRLVHFWATGTSDKLAAAVKSGLALLK